MGEYAEMMLDGTCCSCCGEYLDTRAGYPVMCPSCGDSERKLEQVKTKPSKQRRRKSKKARTSP
jgi:uncharacterized Zn finger protein (UPF0148 family)